MIVGRCDCYSRRWNKAIIGQYCPDCKSTIYSFIVMNDKLEPPLDGGDPVDHPAHYGGADSPHEAIKVIEAWGLGFNLGNTVKYIARADHKGATVQDLRKARWYLDREIARREEGADRS